MPLTIEILSASRTHGQINIRLADGSTVQFGDQGVLDAWLAREPKRCDEALHAALTEARKTDPKLANLDALAGVKYEQAPSTWTKTEAPK
jgi:hypothetical protein